ncbi:MAG: hypothetical protein E6H09_14635 [Bacteroidetes bacterium]|jgi:hypothetical protein|nr:MAG: hypothetical protein E6H09_14635 [Bacteroidota bacterium]
MKRGVSTAVVLLASFFLHDAFAQSTEDDIQIIQGAWGRQKRELVSMAMSLSAKDSVKFWPVYDKYEVTRKKLGRERLLILNDYVESYEKLTNTKADELANRLFKNDAANAQLLQQYYNSMKTALNALQAAKFLHVESFLQSYIKIHLQANLPYIGELDKLKTQ